MPNPPLSRRDFVSSAALSAGALMILPRGVRGAASTSANSRLRIAQIGVGGRGRAPLRDLQAEEFVAFCDVDWQYGRADMLADPKAGPFLAKFPEARWYRDHRLMFEEMADQIDAVVVSTPDHAHFPAAMAAVAHGKHVFVEKPLCRCISEVRRLHAAAKQAGVVTQMGNQGRSYEGIRIAREWVQAGLLGEVHTVHTWTDRPRAPWFHPAGFDPDAVATPTPTPPGLDWDLWLGPAPHRAYREGIAPTLWRSFVDYGSGPLGDMGCHQIDAALYALDLGAPTSVEAATSDLLGRTFPNTSTVTWKFPARGARGPVEMKWFDGALRPPAPVEGHRFGDDGGSVFHGTKGIMTVSSHSNSARLLPESRMRELAGSLPAKTIPRVLGGPFLEWANAIRGGPACGSQFDYGARLTEIVLLGVAAIRARGFLEWDDAAMRFTNRSDANRFIGPGYEYRPGWGI